MMLYAEYNTPPGAFPEDCGMNHEPPFEDEPTAGEIIIDTALKIKELHNNISTFVMGASND